MRFIRRALIALMLVLVMGWALLFALANDAVTDLDLVFVSLPAQSVSLWMIVAFATGGVFGLLASSGALVRAWRNQAALRGELRRLDRSAAQSSTPETVS